MKIPKIRTYVILSENSNCWDILSIRNDLIATVPFLVSYTTQGNIINEDDKKQAFETANFISTCFNVAFIEESVNESIPKYTPISSINLSDALVKNDFDDIIKFLSKDG